LICLGGAQMRVLMSNYKNPPQLTQFASKKTSEYSFGLRPSHEYSLASGQAQSSLASGQAQSSLASGQAQYSLASGQAQYSLASGQPQYSLASGQAQYSLASGQAQYSLASETRQYSLEKIFAQFLVDVLLLLIIKTSWESFWPSWRLNSTRFKTNERLAKEKYEF
jgi:hypothetical protein